MDKIVLTGLPDIPANKELDNVPSRNELNVAISFTKGNKAPGCCGCGIPVEVWNLGGLRRRERLHDLFIAIWTEEQVPQDWTDANIVPILRRVAEKIVELNRESLFSQYLYR